MNGPLLECREMTMHFGGVTALEKVGLSVDPGTIHALIGPNGAGKSTLINAVTGAYRLTSGSIRFCGTDVTGLAPHRRAALGMARTFQNVQLIPSLNALDNIALVVEATARNSRQRRSAYDMAREALAFVGLTSAAGRHPRELSYGQQRLVELARAIARRPAFVLLDEPAAGLNDGETATLGELLKRLLDERGITFLLVDHDVRFVMRVSRRVAVLNFGRKLAEGTPAEVVSNPEVIAAYLGQAETGASGEVS